MKQRDHRRYAIWQCCGGCGGLNDRIKEIWSVFLHSIAIGYEFKIDYNHPVTLFPEILVPFQGINWANISYANDKDISLLTCIDTLDMPFDLCKWKSYESVNVKNKW